MAQEELNAPEAIVERNIEIVGRLMRYLLARPHLLEALPDTFELVVLPDDDREIRLYNLDLLDSYGDQPLVLARLHSLSQFQIDQETPIIYAPLAT
jgi:hypothetical protein